ncbi:MAG: hypothetical protein BWK79_08395 [Beggiatoa sp. IS2]|nr:MAG: hypothetical protein BWK79_08395 [Beggiatoa sp. IS2]
MTITTILQNLKKRLFLKKDHSSSHIPLKYTLMGAFLLLIIPILIAISVIDYLNAKNDLENAYILLQRQTESNILNAIRLAEAGHKVLEKALSKQMEQAFSLFINAYEEAGRNPAKMDLVQLKQQMGGKMDLYVINANGIVEYTTYLSDLGLDFKKWPDFFDTLTAYRQANRFISGHFALEARTGIFRKFSYFPTPDLKYLLELGLKIDEFADLMAGLDLLEITDRLRILNPSLNKARIFSRHGYLIGDPNYKVDPETKTIITEVYNSKKTLEMADKEKERYRRYVFLNLRDENTDIISDPSKVIELTYNTKLIDEGLERTAAFHFIVSSVSIALSIIFTFIISAIITNPIKQLVDSVNIIAQGNLEHPITVKVNHELKILKQSITIMVNNMVQYIHQIKYQNIELKKLDKLKDDFLSNTSHELRTPINGIIGIADSMIDGATGDLPKKVVENLSMIVLSGRRLSNLVNDILDFSKLKHKNIELQIKSIEIAVVADIILTLSKPLLGKKNLILINNIKEEFIVDADENRLQQILHNLISNAIKFTEAGTVEISAKACGNELMLKITDTGIGIPAEKIDKVFTAFEQVDGSILRDHDGTGLGLSIVKQLVELHGGTVQIQSTLGQGTCVMFTLPLSQTEVVNHDVKELLTRLKDLQPIEIAVEEKSKEITNDTTHRKLFNILIVDDDPVNLQVLENVLSLDHYHVVRATNGQEALNAIRGDISFSIVLLDIMMPKMSGFEVCKIIRETHSITQLPIIMLTAKNQVSDLIQGLQAGANDYITKPFSKGELLTRIKTHIQLSRVNTAYSCFVPMEFLKLLGKESIIDVRLGDHVQRYMAVLFADVRSFTSISESMTPKENFDFINTYLGRISPLIRQYHGFIDKYIGDAIMALFPESADNALAAAVEIHKQLEILNKERYSFHLPPIKVGIGLHIGNLMLGTIGEEKRMEGTVISDAVNLASRLEGLSKLYGAAIVVSGEILADLIEPDQYQHRFLGKVRVKGKKEPVHLFEIIDGETDGIKQKKISLKFEFDQAIHFYFQQNFKEAIKHFRAVLTQFPEDAAADFYLRRCEYYLMQGTPPNWEGVESLLQK